MNKSIFKIFRSDEYRFYFKGGSTRLEKELELLFNSNEWGTETRLSGAYLNKEEFEVYSYFRYKKLFESTKLIGKITFSGINHTEITVRVKPSVKLLLNICIYFIVTVITLLSLFLSPNYINIKLLVILATLIIWYITVKLIQADKDSIAYKFETRFGLKRLTSNSEYDLWA